MPTVESKYYAGIGSRGTPHEILKFMTNLAKYLDDLGYILRSGGAKGADKAFEAGATKKEIFKSNDVSPETDMWAYKMVANILPTDRSGFWEWTPYVQGLLARNMMQVLGRDGNMPVRFIVCWTKSLEYSDSSAGGTAYAIRCAIRQNIPVHNQVIDRSGRAVFQFEAGAVALMDCLNKHRPCSV